MSDLFAASVAMEICPIAPGNAQKYVDQITGYVLWGVGVLFLVAVMVSIGAIVAGRLFSMPHASKVGVISIVVVFFCAIAYMVLPGLVGSLMGWAVLVAVAASPRPRRRRSDEWDQAGWRLGPPTAADDLGGSGLDDLVTRLGLDHGCA